MDSQRFDGLARSISRRGFFRTIAGALAGGSAAGVVREQDASAGCNKVCKPDEYMGSGCVCLCKTTGRPVKSGSCPCSPGLTRCGANCIAPCSASDQCHVAGVCNPATGACTNPAAPNGRPCNDGNSGTSGDICTNGVCGGTNRCAGVTCTTSDQCHLAGTCDPATGVCTNPLAPDGTSCDDGNICTESSTCQAGVCSGAIPRPCSTANPCFDVACIPAFGGCVTIPKPDGTPCDDGNPETVGDVCTDGVCGAPR